MIVNGKPVHLLLSLSVFLPLPFTIFPPFFYPSSQLQIYIHLIVNFFVLYAFISSRFFLFSYFLPPLDFNLT